MTTRVLERTQDLPRPLEEIFAFHERPENLQELTPAFLDFRILTPSPVPMHVGSLIDYRIRLFGVPMRWTTRIAAYEPGASFVDEQLRGPYRLWHHTHLFTRLPGGGTRIVDRVAYDVGWGPLGDVAHALFVERALARIFQYRHERMRALFGGCASEAASPSPAQPGREARRGATESA